VSIIWHSFLSPALHESFTMVFLSIQQTDTPHPAASLGEPLHKPPTELVPGLERQPRPGNLDSQCSYASVGLIADSLLTLAFATIIF